MPNILVYAYAANILILLPVLFSMFTDSGGKSIRAFQGRVENSEGLRLLVACLWSSILLLSCLGLICPERFVAVLMLQVVYKSLYLLLYILPKFRREGAGSIPGGLTASFVLIVIVYPVLICFSMT